MQDETDGDDVVDEYGDGKGVDNDDDRHDGVSQFW